MKKSGDSELRDLLWRFNLSTKDEARIKELLAAQPEANPEVLEETRLNQVLDRLPDAPLSSNFTAQVMRAIELEASKNSRQQPGPAWRVGFGWVSRLAMAGVLLILGLLTVQKHQSEQRVELAKSVASLSNVGAMPVEWLENFDTIQNLSSASPVDDELLAALR